MTAFYVEVFKKENKCPVCPKSKVKGYSLCRKHLEYAKTRFSAWSHRRRNEGLCCYCHRKSFQGWLRCRDHTLQNRVRCLAWNQQNPDHSAREWAVRKKLRDAGFCPMCREHRPLKSGFLRCEPCRERQRQHNKKGRNL